MNRQKTTTKYKDIPENLAGAVPDNEMLKKMPFELMKDLRAFVLQVSGDSPTIAASNPENETLQKYVLSYFGAGCEVLKTTPEHVSNVLDSYSPDYEQRVIEIIADDVLNNGNISRLVDCIINHAISEGVSDVHIEPRRNDALVRFRSDGILHTRHTINKNVYQAVVARIKVMADLKIDESRRPQDGRIELTEINENTSLRVSTVPTLFGEKVVFRVLTDSIGSLSVDDLGFTEKQKEVITRNVEKPFGMIVASGPTGSGKTTSLYAMLQLLQRDGINISTLEDPIEGVLHGVNQIQINTGVGLTFASGLRSLLRQDPDVIMVGEIRDSETAVMSANAAMTGHLVFSTLHTNDAPSAFGRFLEMGVGDFVVASTVNLVIAQRLARRVCSKCAKEEPLEESVLRKIEGRKDVLGALKGFGVKDVNALKEKKFKKGSGCDKCFDTGYSGRIGLYELIEPNKEIRELILEEAPSEKIKELAKGTDSYNEMIEDGVGKIFAGATTFEEVMHITRSST